jgi:hypothetical protein
MIEEIKKFENVVDSYVSEEKPVKETID